MQEYSLEVVTPPTDEPVSLVEIKAHLRVTNDAENSLIGAYMAAAREYVEMFTRQKLMTQTIRLSWTAFGDGISIRLPIAPVQSVSSVQYRDGAGALQTWGAGNYALDVGSWPPRITLAYGAAWPQSQAVENAVRLNVVAGYADASKVPPALKAAILLLAGDLYANREAQGTRLEENKAVERLLWPHRLLQF